MNKKVLIFIAITTLNLIILNSSELRLRGMSGISPNGLFVVQDSWCDSFFVNPAYAPENRFLLINLYNNINIMIDKKREDGDHDTNSIDNSSINFTLYEGMLIPIKNFSFGFDFSFLGNYLNNKNEYSYYYHYYYSYYPYYDSFTDYDNGISITNQYYLKSKILFSWNINKFVNIGFDIGIKSSLFDSIYSGYDNNDTRVDVIDKYYDSKPINLTASTTFGLLFKNDKIKFSLSIPVNLTYYTLEWLKINDSAFPYDSNKYDRDKSYYTEKLTSDSNYIFEIGLRTSLDIDASKKIMLRIPFQINFSYQNALMPDEIMIRNNYFKEYYFEIKSGFSINNRINEKVLLFYGFDTNYSITNSYRYRSDKISSNDDQNYYYYFIEPNFKFGLFIGGEFNVLKWLDIRSGINFNFFNYDHSLTYHIRDEDEKYDIDLAVDTSITSGITFKPSNNFSIELNTNFYINRFNFSKASSYYSVIDRSKDERSSTFTFDVGFVIKIDTDKKKSEEKNESIIE